MQWFLPIDLMSLPIEHWQIQTGKNRQHCNGKRCKSAIVRSADRHLPDYRSVVGEWKKNWQYMLTRSQLFCTDTLKDGLYNYDAIARLQDAQASKKDHRQETGNYITLVALGTAFLPADLPRVLLIDEIDKSDIDLPNDLLNLLEDGEFPKLTSLEERLLKDLNSSEDV